MKKALTLALSAALAIGSVMPVMAEDGYNGYNGYDYYQNGTEADEAQYENGQDLEYNFNVGDQAVPLAPFGRTGNIAEYEDGTLKVELAEDDYIILHIQPTTVIIDAETGMPATIADRTSDRVKIYHSPVVTRSIPPQSTAVAIAINLPEYRFAPILHTIEAVEFYGEDTLRITVDNGGLIITLERETPLFPHLTRQMISLEHLQVGDSLLFWYHVVGMSYPAFTTAERALWLSAGESATDYNGVENQNYNQINNQTDLDITNYVFEPIAQPEEPKPPEQVTNDVIRNGVPFFAVRNTVYDIAGLQPIWIDSIRSAIYNVNGSVIVLPSGSNVFYVNGVAYQLSADTFLYNGRLYATAEFFDLFR